MRPIADGINERIREANRKGSPAPSLILVPFNVENIANEWREQRQRDGQPPEPQPDP